MDPIVTEVVFAPEDLDRLTGLSERLKRSEKPKKPRAPKPVRVSLIERQTAAADPASASNPYPLLDDLIARHHPDLVGANLVLLWLYAVKADKDDRLTLGYARRETDGDKERSRARGRDPWELTIHLNYEAWQHFTEAQRAALLDHELCHFRLSLDKDGERQEDERGGTLWRMRGHDIEEFKEIVERHGLWKRDLEEFAKAFPPVAPAQEATA